MAGPNTCDPPDQWCNFITQSVSQSVTDIHVDHCCGPAKKHNK
uniref:Uncharacterized protein n=1 Tax=Anguilla anguilla TaxID=7936 RepID=A0A0E9XBB3_ANGAN